jgi:oligoendopeptidase F
MSTPLRSHAPILLLAIAAALASLPATAAQGVMKPGAAIAPAPAPSAGNWELADLYPSLEAWEGAYRATVAQVDALPGLKGKLGASAAALREGLVAISNANRSASRLLTYASLLADEDLRISANTERQQRAQALFTRLGERTAWLAPEVIALGPARVQQFVAADAVLRQRFDYFLGNLLRGGPHTLGLEAEQVLAAAGDLQAQPAALQRQLANAEFAAPTVTLADGSSVVLDSAAYSKYRYSANRADRKKVFDAYWAAWQKVNGTAGAMLTTQVMSDLFTAKSRHYDSALQAAQFPDNMPEAVYRTLIAETHAGLPALHRYYRLRARVMGISDGLRYYDGYPPMVQLASAPHYDVAAAERITLAALAPMGEEYLAKLRTGFAGKWMSVAPAPGKYFGAYMNPGAYDVHPYLLFNYNDDYESLSTFAHEWGHAVHTQLANQAQPYEKSNYSIFIAESASIGNQMLLEDYLIGNAKTREDKLFFIGQGIESIRSTFFRQAMFAEFELAIHEELEHGRALSGPRMSQLYCALLRQYSGEAEGAMKIDEPYCTEWAFVPHFYMNYYVYQYATSIAGAAGFTDQIIKEGAPARARFLALLAAGGSDYPYELYRRAGIDMATPAPYRALVARMNRLLDEFEALLAQPPGAAADLGGGRK